MDQRETCMTDSVSGLHGE